MANARQRASDPHSFIAGLGKPKGCSEIPLLKISVVSFFPVAALIGTKGNLSILKVAFRHRPPVPRPVSSDSLKPFKMFEGLPGIALIVFVPFVPGWLLQFFQRVTLPSEIIHTSSPWTRPPGRISENTGGLMALFGSQCKCRPRQSFSCFSPALCLAPGAGAHILPFELFGSIIVRILP